MDNLFQEFSSSNLEEWKAKIVKDLKGKELSVLDFHDPIEDLDFRAFYHREERSNANLTPDAYPATRGSKTNNNDWGNGALILVDDEKRANKNALDLLMKGANVLYFEGRKENIDWKGVLNEVKLEFIKAQFNVKNAREAKEITAIAESAQNNISFCFDILEAPSNDALHQMMKESQSAMYLVNGFGVQKCGANTWQEIAFCLTTGHEVLLKLMQVGFSIDEAAAQIHFHVGVGANYFNEIGKLRALRLLWSKVIDAYQPQHNCSYNCQLTAVIGHTNKSLRDPYTNLLRQTTEAMAAANSADTILVLPYDLYSNEGSSQLSERMALNISNILKEESYLHQVIDASGGSYTIEQLTDKIAQKAWSYFQELDNSGGILDTAVQSTLKSAIIKTSEIRTKRYVSGDATLIGVNKYPDTTERDATWQEVPGYLGMPPFLAENIEKTTLA